MEATSSEVGLVGFQGNIVVVDDATAVSSDPVSKFENTYATRRCSRLLLHFNPFKNFRIAFFVHFSKTKTIWQAAP